MTASTDAKGRKGASKPKVIRTLSHIECMQSSLHVTRQMCGTIVTCRYAIPPQIAREASLDTLKSALRDGIARTVLEHPLLQVGQINEDSSLPSWVQLDSIDIDWHVRWATVKSEEDYEAGFRQENLREMDTWFVELETRPGWRVTVVHREGDFEGVNLMLAWNHANFDGMGAKIFHETLLRNLNHPDHPLDYTSAGVLPLPDAAKHFPPRVEDVAKFHTGVRFAASSAWGELKPRRLISKSSPHAHWCPIKTEPFDSDFRTIIIDPMTLKNLLVECRKHKTTITALLHALTMVSLAVQLPKETAAMTSITALDHRRFLPLRPKEYPTFEPHRTLANIVSIMFHEYPNDLLSTIRNKTEALTSPSEVIRDLEDIVWSTAGTTRGEIQGRLDAGLKNDLVGLGKFVKDWRSQMRGMAKRPRAASWGVTNLGVIDGGGEGVDGWQITRSWFQTSTEVTAGALLLAAVSVKGGELMVDVDWQACTMDAAIGEKTASDLKTWMDHLGQQKDNANGTAA